MSTAITYERPAERKPQIVIGPGCAPGYCDCTGKATHCMSIGRADAYITIHRDGRVEAPSIEAASSAGEAFVQTLRQMFGR